MLKIRLMIVLIVKKCSKILAKLKNTSKHGDDTTENIVKCSECKKELPKNHEAIKHHMLTTHTVQRQRLRKKRLDPFSDTALDDFNESVNSDVEFGENDSELETINSSPKKIKHDPEALTCY